MRAHDAWSTIWVAAVLIGGRDLAAQSRRGSIRARLLTQATAARVLCESGRTREAARAAAAGWTQRAGRETASALLRMTYGDI